MVEAKGGVAEVTKMGWVGDAIPRIGLLLVDVQKSSVSSSSRPCAMKIKVVTKSLI